MPKEQNAITRIAIGKALVKMRKEKKMTQMDIVRLLGYSRPAINAIEKGNNNYVINQLLDYCQLLEADLKVGRLEGGEVLRLKS